VRPNDEFNNLCRSASVAQPDTIFRILPAGNRVRRP